MRGISTEVEIKRGPVNGPLDPPPPINSSKRAAPSSSPQRSPEPLALSRRSRVPSLPSPPGPGADPGLFSSRTIGEVRS